MNAKKAKALRKVLKNLVSHQLPNGETISQETTYTENKLNRKTIVVDDMNEAGELVKKEFPIAAGTITVGKKTQRGLYLHLKKAMKNPAEPQKAPVVRKFIDPVVESKFIDSTPVTAQSVDVI
jgi:predicted RNA-binding protein YlxR (DUF448 family)